MTTALRHGAVQAAIYAALDQSHAEAEKRIDADILRIKLGGTPTDLLAFTEEQCADRLAALEAELAA